jgi:restriction system protein
MPFKMIKMPKNSLFAVLLRSSWWISFAIALGFAMLSKAFLPADIWLYGAFGGMVFVVIGGMSLARQLRLPSRKKVEAIAARVRESSWPAFSAELELAFRRDGYSVTKLDGPADFAITRSGRVGLVCAKRWKAAQHSEESVRLLHAAKADHGAADCTLIALEPLGEKAWRFAEAKGVQVMQAPGLAQLLKK